MLGGATTLWRLDKECLIAFPARRLGTTVHPGETLVKHAKQTGNNYTSTLPVDIPTLASGSLRELRSLMAL